MVQKLHLSVEIPDGYVLITKVEYDEMQKLADKGNSWETIAWFKQETGIKHPDTLKTMILYPFRKELEKFVMYPEKKGSPWRFHRAATLDWLENNFGRSSRGK